MSSKNAIAHKDSPLLAQPQRMIEGTMNEDLHLVSIIFLSYNQEKFLKEALQGLFSQTYPRLDIVIMDDASTDRSADIITRTLASVNRADIRFIRNEQNMGEHGRASFLKGLS